MGQSLMFHYGASDTNLTLNACFFSMLSPMQADLSGLTYTLRQFSGLRTSHGTSGWLVLHAQPIPASQSSPASSPSPRHPATPQTAPQETLSRLRPPGIQ